MWRIVQIGLLLLGIGLRTWVYLANRSLFLDEANLARALIEGGSADFFAPLPYEQFAPPLFLVGTKMLTHFWDTSEPVLRGLPFLFGVFSVGLFWRIAVRWLPPAVATVALLVFALHPALIRYATEFKQYGVDVAVGLFALHCLATPPKERRDYLVWGSFMLAPWLSMPIVFPMGAAGLVWLVRCPHDWRRWLLVCGLWLGSFATYFFLVLRSDIGSDYLQSYHAPYFLGSENTPGLLKNLIQQPFGYTIAAQAFGWVGLVLAAWRLYLRREPWLWLSFATVALTLLASALHLYTLIDRTVLFLTPFLLLMAAAGWAQRRALMWGFVAYGLHYATLENGLRFPRQPLMVSEARPLLTRLAAAQPAVLYLDAWARPPFWYYVRRPGAPLDFSHTDVRHAESEPPGAAGWYLMGHLLSNAHRTEAERWLTDVSIVERWDAPGAGAVRFEAAEK